MPKSYKIALMPGDGTGPEVVAEAVKVVKAAAKKGGFSLGFKSFNYGGERYKKTGETISDKEIDGLRKFDAILLGAIGHPDVKPGILEKGILLKLRFELDQYINLRPVKLYPGRRDPAQGQGAGGHRLRGRAREHRGPVCRRGRSPEEGHAGRGRDPGIDQHPQGRGALHPVRVRVLRRKRKKKKLTLCGKTNVLTFAFDLWERAFYEVAKEYPTSSRTTRTWTRRRCGW